MNPELSKFKRTLALALVAGLPLVGLASTPVVAMQLSGQMEDVWKPAPTPRGGVSWQVLEATGERTRKDSDGYILSKPVFTKKVQSLACKGIKVAGWILPLENGSKQKRFVLFACPPGCPVQFPAAPNQFMKSMLTSHSRTTSAGCSSSAGYSN